MKFSGKNRHLRQARITCKAVKTVQTIDICADIGRQNANASQN
jgi:hypothetical protein